MNELLEKGLALFPEYFRDLIALTTGPKRFVAARLPEKRVFEKAFIFLGMSYGFGFILKASLFQQNLWLALATGAAFTLVQAVSYGTAIWLAWRAVGGSGTLTGTIVITLYYTAIVDFISGFMVVGMLGAVRLGDPALYEEMLAATGNGTIAQLATQTERLAASAGVRLGLLILLVLTIVFAIWIVAGWGAYRLQHRLTPARSIPAFLLFIVFCVPVSAMLFIVATALTR